MRCPTCGGSAIPDPEHARSLRCLTCWRRWTLPAETRCPGVLPRLSPALRALNEHRDLNR